MKIFFKTLMLAAVAASMSFVAACSDDDNNESAGSIVSYEKKSDTAILLVTFGSTWDDPHVTYEKQKAAFGAAFPNADIFFSFTSKTCINRWKAATGEQFITPDLYLESFIEKGYEHVYVQSLHVIPGEEFQVLRDGYVKPHYNFLVADLTPEREPACCGEALLKSTADQKAVAKILVDVYADQLRAGDAVAFMGHGNPISDYDHANASYEGVEREMQAYAQSQYGNDNVFVGTVDYPAMLIDYVIDELEASSCTTKKVHLHPLMSIAGDHANNDMAGDYEEGVPMDEQSWKTQISNIGWTVECTRKGLGDYDAINAIWVSHLRTAIASLAEEE